MLLLMIERGMPIDIVLTADTGMEFPEMYDHLAKLDEYLYRERGIHLTMLRHPKGFEYMMFEEEKQKISSIENRQKLGVPLYGNGWPGVRVRWCTGQLKTHLIAKEVNRLKGKYRALHYVGIAADEPKRIKNEQYPLVDWGITEAKALKICYDRGYDWGGLYEIYHRCSCWCCPFQRIDELRKLRHHHPELWQKLRDMDQRAIAQFGHNPLGQFKQNWTVERLEQRFAAEDAQISVFLSSGKDSTILRVALSIPSTIGLETTLSYLGLGLDINIPSLGILLRNSRAFFLDYPYLLIFPAVIVSLVTITFYLAGNAFSDAADPRNHV